MRAMRPPTNDARRRAVASCPAVAEIARLDPAALAEGRSTPSTACNDKLTANNPLRSSARAMGPSYSATRRKGAAVAEIKQTIRQGDLGFPNPRARALRIGFPQLQSPLQIGRACDASPLRANALPNTRAAFASKVWNRSCGGEPTMVSTLSPAKPSPPQR
jgi:hypothetical protein